MGRSQRTRKKIPITNASFSKQAGFTYVELTISMFLILVMVPTIFFCLFSFVNKSQTIMSNQRLQLDWMASQRWMQNEIKQGNHFRVKQEALLFDMPDGKTVRYQWSKGTIVRQLKEKDDPRFQGYTLLLPRVESFRFLPDQQGVWMAFTLKDPRSRAKHFVRTYVGGRTENESE